MEGEGTEVGKRKPHRTEENMVEEEFWKRAKK